jgi:RNA polymerase sigma-B factor
MVVGRENEKRLFLAYRRDGDQRARDALIEQFLPLARSLARRYRRGPEPLEDLEQVASLALVKAVDGFDPERDTAFSSYAVPSIVGAIKRHFRDRCWALHMPRDLQDLAVRVERLGEEMSGRTGASPTASEIADAAGVAIEDVLEARAAYHALHPTSLDQPLRGADDESVTLLDTLDAADAEIPDAIDRVLLDSLLATLESRSRLIVRLYYLHDQTQDEIGRRLGISQMHVSRLLRQGIAQLATNAQPSDSKPRLRAGPRVDSLLGTLPSSDSLPPASNSPDPRALPTLMLGELDSAMMSEH